MRKTYYVYTGRRKTDANQIIATDFEQNAASEVVQNSVSKLQIDDITEPIGDPNTCNVDAISENVASRNLQYIDLTGIDGSNLEVEQTVDLPSFEQNEETTDTNMITLTPNFGVNFDNIRLIESLPPTHDFITKPNMQLLTNQDPIDTIDTEDTIDTKDTIDTVDTIDTEDTIDIDTEVVWLPVSPEKQKQVSQELENSALPIHDEMTASPVSRGVREQEISKVIRKVDIAPSPNRIYSVMPSIALTANSKKIKRFSLSKMKFCKQWLKHLNLPGFEQDCKLMEYVSSKIDLDSVIESQDHIKNIISHLSFRLSKMYAKSGKNPHMLIKNYSAWLNGSHIKFTPAVGVTQKSTVSRTNRTVIVTQKQPQNPPVEKQQPSTKKEVIHMSLVTNADVYKLLTMSQPPFRAETLYSILIALSKEQNKERQQKVKEFCNRYVADTKFKWMTADYKENVFESKFAFWLGLNVRWPVFLKAVLVSRNPKANEAFKTEKTLDIEELEQDITKKCCEYGQGDVSNIIHRLFHHPEDAVRIRSFVENSVCSCNPKSAESDNSTEQDPLMPESEIYRTTDASEGVRLTDNNTLERVYRAPSGARLDALKQALNKLKDKTKDKVKDTAQINKESERRDMVKLVLSKLESGKTNVNNPVLTSESNKIVNTAGLTEKSNNIVNTPALTKESTQKETVQKSKRMEFGPVLDKLIYWNSVLDVKNGTKVKLSTGKIATVVKVSNIRGATVLMPKSNIQSGFKVQPNRSINCQGTMPLKPHSINRKQMFPESSSNEQGTPPVTSSSEKRRIGILRRLPKKPLADTSHLIYKGVLPLTPFNQPITSTYKKLVKETPSIVKKLNPVQSSSSKITVCSKAPSSINTSVEALMADINNGDMQQKETMQTSLSRLLSHSKLLQSHKNPTDRPEKETGVQSSLNQLISHYKVLESVNLSKTPQGNCDVGKKTKTAIVFTPKTIPLSHCKTLKPPAKRLSEQTEFLLKKPWRLEE